MGKLTWPLTWEADPPWMRKIELRALKYEDGLTLWETNRGEHDAPELIYEVYDYSTDVGTIVLQTAELIELKCWLIAKGYLDG